MAALFVERTGVHIDLSVSALQSNEKLARYNTYRLYAKAQALE